MCIDEHSKENKRRKHDLRLIAGAQISEVVSHLVHRMGKKCFILPNVRDIPTRGHHTTFRCNVPINLAATIITHMSISTTGEVRAHSTARTEVIYVRRIETKCYSD